MGQFGFSFAFPSEASTVNYVGFERPTSRRDADESFDAEMSDTLKLACFFRRENS